MIKKLQALKAKKGFTLVELVVVIAIIGVLAAILIPVMIGVVQDANITSADTLAKQIYSNTQTFCTKADTAKNSLKNATSLVTLYATVSKGAWTIYNDTAGSSAYKPTSSAKTIMFGNGEKYTFNYTDAEKEKETALAAYLGDVLRDFTDGAVHIYFAGNACVGAAVEQGAGVKIGTNGNSIPTTIGAVLAGTGAKEINWGDSNKAGVGAGGAIIGTSPKIGHNAKASAPSGC